MAGKATTGVKLAVGDVVRYHGLGAGRVQSHQNREFRGEDRVFAEIVFPHHDLRVQVPVGDDKLLQKIHPVATAGALKALLGSLAEAGRPLARTWDERELAARKLLRDGGPDEWTQVLRDYAHASRDGMAVVATDADAVCDAQLLLAAEVAAARTLPLEEALSTVKRAYERAAKPKKPARSAVN